MNAQPGGVLAAAPSQTTPASGQPSISASASAATVPVLNQYAAFEKPLSEPCGDARVVLAVRDRHDRSGRLAVQQSLLANPEFKVVPEKAQAPFEVDFYETIYGTKNFARKYPGDPMFREAVIGRCADVNTCNQLASMFHAAFPREQVELSCGVPGRTTGGFSRVYELAPERLVVPSTKAPLAASCARAVACLSRERSALPLKPQCAGIARERLQGCAERASCGDVAPCIARELR